MKISNCCAVCALVVFGAFSFGCVEDSTSPLSLSSGSAGEAGSGGTAGTGGTGGESPECEPDGVKQPCECPDGTDGTQECEDGEFGECECLYYPDGDGDKHGDEGADPHPADDPPAGHVGNHDDCDDENASTYPGAEEVCDGEDNDCDGQVDEGNVCGSSRTWYEDADDDSYGNPNRTKVAVEKPAGYVSDDTDCDDGNSNVNPGAQEICGNGIDDDCDGQTDENCQEPKTYHRDNDGDGYGDPSQTVSSTNQPQGYVLDHSDCNDGNASVHPGATEVCNDVDDDCDGQVDEGLNCSEPQTWYNDSDGDGYGNPAHSTVANTQPSGYVANDDDCDDTRSSVHPGATEVCNNVDDDCDGQVDEGLQCGGTFTYYRDADGDSYTTSETMTSSSSTPPAGWRATESNPLDCDDNNAGRNPGATEVCGNNVDDDCDGQVDEGCSTGCTDGAKQSCTCVGGSTGSQTCVDGDWAACVCGGTTTIKIEVDCSTLPWSLNPEPQGSWDGRDYGNFTGCSSTGTGKTACTFTMPAPDYPSFIGQGHAGYGKYAGDASGDSPAPCYTPAQVGAMNGTTITLLCSVRLWKDGAPQELRWETNSLIVQNSTQSCSESGYFPYYNAVPAL